MNRYVLPVLSIVIAAGIQGNLPHSMTILGAKPDLVLVVLIAYSLAADPEFGAGLGFIAGLIQGSAVGLSLGSFIVTRTITGFLAGLVTTRLFSDNLLVPAASAIWLTLVCEGLFLLTNPRLSLIAALGAIVGECLFNAILSIFLYWVFRGFETRRKIRLADARF